ncbi:MAG: hypothetical protein J7623_20675 [Chitinophaga sp.]|uniref:hypothetical protein n=1 Tax=Chitinophaga sp. TaxID=1869181 RepID=UPI001B2CECB8|nr:hypothetical protein [Chitinophaga sp.]MBO9731064.1 hypothetical protein [Chitinophaga sp.]
MIQIALSYKNREYLPFEDGPLAQIAETTRKLLSALLEDIYDLVTKETGRFLIYLDHHPKIEVEGFSRDLSDQIERTLRGEPAFDY